MTTVILVKYKLPKIENECIKSVLDNTENYNLVVYDNAPLNINLGKLWNRLIEQSDTENICLLNTDTIVEPNWLSRLEEDLLPGIGAVGPVTNSSKNSQCRSKSVGVFPLPREEMLSGFCLLFSKNVWKEAGGFPEDFGFYGQETAMMKKVQSLGYTQMVDTGVFVYHYGSASAKAANMDLDTERQKGRTLYQRFKDLCESK